MTLDSILTWLDNPAHIILLGAIAGQLVLALPDSRFKTYAINVLHGLFPSPQVFANGAPSVPKSVELVGELLTTHPVETHVAAPVAVVPPAPVVVTVPVPAPVAVAAEPTKEAP